MMEQLLLFWVNKQLKCQSRCNFSILNISFNIGRSIACNKMNGIEENLIKLPRIAFIACGCFSPPTPMHFRLFEIARDFFEMQGTHSVVGGIMSPTNDAYGKKDLAPGNHRYAMLQLGLRSSNWIKASNWEIGQPRWCDTRSVLEYHQNFLNNCLKCVDTEEMNGNLPSWVPSKLFDREESIQLKLLCGADLLESFAVPGLWADEDIESIVSNHGLVVISRSGSNPEKFIFESDILTKYQRNITLITNWVPNEVSSSLVRRLLKRGQSVKYLINDDILNYIRANKLFAYKSSSNVFCCGDTTDSNNTNTGRADKAKISSNRAMPGLAIQIITNEKGDGVRTKAVIDSKEVQTKKIKLQSAQDV